VKARFAAGCFYCLFAWHDITKFLGRLPAARRAMNVRLGRTGRDGEKAGGPVEVSANCVTCRAVDANFDIACKNDPCVYSSDDRRDVSLSLSFSLVLSVSDVGDS